MAIHNDDICNKHKILVTTSTFPRYSEDPDPPFVYELCTYLRCRYFVTVLAPHALNLKTTQRFKGLSICRFRYFFQKGEILAYDGGILSRLRHSPITWGIVPFFVFGETFAVLKLLALKKYSIINAHWAIPQGLCVYLARTILRSKIPFICTVHGGDIFALRDPFSSFIKRCVFFSCDAIVAVSRAVRDRIYAMGIPAEKISVIPMGVDLQHRFVPPDLLPSGKSLLFVGRLVSKKGIQILIESLPIVLSKHPDIRLTIVGGGPEEDIARHRVKELGLEKIVSFTGALPQKLLPSYYQSSSILIFPSIVDPAGDTEGLGLVMIEAMGCGCAVIASDLPAVHDIIKDHETGLLVQPNNPAALAEKIIFLLDNPSEQIRIRKNARDFVLKYFDWSITAQAYYNLIDNLIKKQS